MYTLGRRTKISLIIPFLFLVVMAVKYILADIAYKNALNTRRLVAPPVMTPYGIALFVLQLILIYILSVLFLSVETLVKIFITDKDSPQSIAAAQAIRSASWPNKFNVIRGIETTSPGSMVTHSVLFQSLMILLCIYAATSSDSILGKGLTLSIALQLLIDQAILLKNKQNLSSWFWQIKLSLPVEIHEIYFGVVTALTILAFYLTIK